MGFRPCQSAETGKEVAKDETRWKAPSLEACPRPRHLPSCVIDLASTMVCSGSALPSSLLLCLPLGSHVSFIAVVSTMTANELLEENHTNSRGGLGIRTGRGTPRRSFMGWTGQDRVI